MPVPTPLEYGELLDGARSCGRRKRARNGARSRNSALLATDLSGDGSSSLLGKRGTRRASSVAGSDRRGSSLDRGQLAPTAHAMAPFTRAGGPRQASLQAWPAAAIDGSQGIHRGSGRGRYLNDFLLAAAPAPGVELKGARGPSGPARSSRKLHTWGLKGGLRGKRF